MSATDSRDIQDRVREASQRKRPLRIVGGDSKNFYGRKTVGDRLDISSHSGIVSYEPSELVITARAGTRLSVISNTLAGSGQMLAFEPPGFGEAATLGGTLACGFSGPRRAQLGSARDYVLGINLINGSGDWLHFGGEVMKNVAGYDVSRLQVGAMGTLGVITEASLKVLPMPPGEITLGLEMTQADAIAYLNRLGAKPLPVSASLHRNNRLMLRLSGNESAVKQARNAIGGEAIEQGELLWEDVREHRLPELATNTLWRLSLPPATPPLPGTDNAIIEWGGALRWINGDSEQDFFSLCAKAGGHATRFRSSEDRDDMFQPLAPPLAKLHGRLKERFDPQLILNPGRMYA